MGKSLNELMGWPGPMTHRQFVAWQAWLQEQQNVPSRADSYAMQVAFEVNQIPARLFSKKRSAVKLSHFRLKYEKPKKTSVEQSKAVWLAAVSPRRKKKRDQDQNS